MNGDHETAQQIAQMRGELSGLSQLITSQNQDTHRRLDDKFSELKEDNRELVNHLNGLGQRVDSADKKATTAKETALSAQNTADQALDRTKRTGTVWGAGAGGAIVAAVEALKILSGKVG